jgi:hypothetical protein
MLSGSLMAGESLVICNSGISDGGACDQTSGTISHNGNDAYELVCGGVIVDSFGRVGEDPGSEWMGGGVSTKDWVLRRRCTSSADTTPDDAFDPSVDWDGFAVASAPEPLFDDLGTYSCP